MDCKHERLRTVGDRVFCCGCGVELPLEALTGEQKQVQKPPADEQPVKSPAKKKTAGKAGKGGKTA